MPAHSCPVPFDDEDPVTVGTLGDWSLLERGRELAGLESHATGARHVAAQHLDREPTEASHRPLVALLGPLGESPEQLLALLGQRSGPVHETRDVPLLGGDKFAPLGVKAFEQGEGV